MHIIHELITAAASRRHTTEVTGASWNTETVRALEALGEAGRMGYAWADDDSGALLFPHHFTDADGVGAASTEGCRAAIEQLNRKAGAVLSETDRQKVYDHLVRHLTDAEVEVPDLKAYDIIVHLAAAHGKMSGSHTHAHPTYGKQGGDKSHEHMHRHSDDGTHNHDHSAKVPARTASAWPAGRNVMVSAATVSDEPTTAALAASAVEAWSLAHEPMAEVLAAAYGVPAEGSSLVAAAMTALGSPWGVEQSESGWALRSQDGEVGVFESYAEALADLSGRAFADAERPVLSETWRSEMCFEDVETGDGRYIAPGALQYRDCPLPLMLQVVTDMGHFGAILAGTILSAKTVNGTSLGSGEFDDSDTGRQFVDIVNARGKYGVSIDGMSPAEAEFECTQRDDEEGYCIDGRMRFNLLTIGGLTGTPFPAFKDAYLALEQRAATASALTEVAASAAEFGEAVSRARDTEPPCVECEDEARARAAGGVIVTKEDPLAVGHETPEAFTAAGEEILGVPYSSEFFANPGFAIGDGRVVLQPDRKHYACPHTVLADGRVFGHMAGWFTCHTGYAESCVLAPRSQTGYAAFMLRPVMTADGQVVRIGHLTMGCGHADTDRPVPVGQVRAHYDGGPGAQRMAYVVCGEDEFGIWYAGGVNPTATPEQVREFAACSVSGDWREVWRGRGLDLVACLAGVTVPGFPVASALAAAGIQIVTPDHALPADPIARFTDGRPTALVAAGMVRRPFPWERQTAELTARLDRMEALLADATRVTSQLRPLAVERLVAALEPAPALVD